MKDIDYTTPALGTTILSTCYDVANKKEADYLRALAAVVDELQSAHYHSWMHDAPMNVRNSIYRSMECARKALEIAIHKVNKGSA